MERFLAFTAHSGTPLVVLGSLYVLEGSVLLAAMALHMNGDGPFTSLLTGRYAPFFLSGLIGALLSTGYLIAQYDRSSAHKTRQFWLMVATNFITVALLAMAGELTVRILSSATPRGLQFLGTSLIPYSWERVAAHYGDILRTNPNHISYFVADDLLGWTVGPSRLSRDGLYASSREGIRSPDPGNTYADRAPACRIALLGDSFTFGLEVPFEDTWGAQLEQRLGQQVQVLNFGVDGYGVDQSYLRYQRDARPWYPDIVILGFINHDLYRSLAVYSFLSFPGWEFPFAKPRFVLSDDGILLANTPLPPPETIFASRSITDLPYLQYEPGYDSDQWQWRPLYHSYLARFVFSRFPRARRADAGVPDDVLISLNREIILSFIKLARTEGSTPLVVYFPSRGDFEGEQSHLEKRREKDRVLDELRNQRMEYVDLTSCLSRTPPGELFIEGRPHYSANGNRAVADCLIPVVTELLARREPTEHTFGVKPGSAAVVPPRRETIAKQERLRLSSRGRVDQQGSCEFLREQKDKVNLSRN